MIKISILYPHNQVLDLISTTTPNDTCPAQLSS